jgi:predicted cobalt transporter CbtA
MVDEDRGFWQCTVGAAFGLALALIAFRFGFWAFLIAAALMILGGVGAWFFGRILS